MADEVGRLNIYEVAYGPASELRHMPFAGVIAHDLNWLREALYIAHGALLATVAALYNIAPNPGSEFGNRLRQAIDNFSHTRKK